MIPFWEDNPFAWDQILIAGVQMPPKWRVEGAISRKLEVKNAPGADGSYVRDQGYQPQQIRLTYTMWTAQHLAALDQLLSRPGVKPQKQAKPQALDVVHPQLELLGIREIIVESISTLKETGSGIYEITFTAWESSPLKKVGVKKIAPSTGPTQTDESRIAPIKPSSSVNPRNIIEPS
jgi:hypothetical protein